MTSDEALPDIRFALPLNSENRWSDLLAVLIATDPALICTLLGLTASPEHVVVEREVTIDSANRPDVILRVAGQRVAVIEVKVLAGLGPKQLDRYRKVEAGADKYVVVFPERLLVDTSAAPAWLPVTWEAVLAAYAASTHQWVQTCARAWQDHLAAALPKVDPSTRWNGLTDGEGFVVAMRARASWVYSNLRPPEGIELILGYSSAGASTTVQMFTPAAPGYVVTADVEERRGVRDIPKFANAATKQPLGPSVKVMLRQDGVTTSADFDWDYLLSMWPLMQAARDDWVQSSARPKDPIDKANHQAMVAKRSGHPTSRDPLTPGR